LNHGRYETLKARFSNLAAERGYFDGYFELSQVSVNLKEDSARVELVYNTGPRYRFGEISIEQEIFDENFVRRYLNFETGDPYDSEKLLDLKNYYNASNFFALATVSPDLQQLENTQVPVNIKLDARKRRGYSLGAGIATDTGPRLLLGYEDRYVTDTGHSFAAMAHVATVKSSIEATYTIPMRRPAHEFLKFSTGFQREETDDTLSNLTRIGTNYSIYHEDSWLQVYALNYEMEDFVIADEDERRSHLIIPSVQYSRTTYDETAYPLRGWRVMGKLAGSPESLGSKVSFLQFTGHAKYIYPAFGGRFLTRLDVGATEVDETDELPVSVRYFAGGDTSVRGYSYKSIAHEDDEGRVIGGNSLLTASVEYDYLVRPKWALAVFYDIGDAPNDYNFEFKRSVGIGVRWISPIGPVRVDIACALDGVRCSSSSVEGWGLHLSMGPDL
jgi:translocation and assembly module TamA